MAEISIDDQRPLLSAEDDDIHDPVVFNPTNVHTMSLDSDDRVARENEKTEKRRRQQNSSNRQLVVAIFVVSFDTKKGNIVEWCYPDGIELEDIEFRAMASGFHNVDSDFIYFKQKQLFGVSCYEKVSVDSVEERGARMRSIGLVASSYSNLHTHMEFLQEQAKLRLQDQDYDYGLLSDYFWNIQSPREQMVSTSSLATADLPHMEITHPAGCFNQFLQFFGPMVFSLWRLALLKKRILIVSSPPVGILCYRVYCTSVLASHNIDNLDLHTELNPLFFVNVADIDMLEKETSFIACTTERIFESKKTLYDIYIDNQAISATSTRLDPFLRLTPADHQRYNKLTSSQNFSLTLARSMQSKVDEDLACARYFQQLNTELYTMLLEAESAEDHLVTVEMISALGLDPNKDRIFLTELASLHRLNVTIQRQSDVFSCCI